MGKVLESRIKDMIRECPKPGISTKNAGRNTTFLTNDGRKAILDFLIKANDAVILLEIKYRLPKKSASAPFGTALKQMQAAIDNSFPAAIVGGRHSGLKTDKRVKDFVEALEGNKGFVHVFDGFADLVSYLGEFLLDECL